MSKYDYTYKALVEDILENGIMDEPEVVRGKYVTDNEPAPAKSLMNKQIIIDASKEVPLLQSKHVGQKDPVKELLWIWQKMSNNVQELRDMGCNVWNEWELKDGSIGKAYGWQLRNKTRKVRFDELALSMTKNNEFSIKVPFSEEEWNGLQKEIQDGKEFYIDLNQVDYLLYSLKKNPYSRQIKTTLWCVEDIDDMALPPCVYETHWYKFNGKLNLTVNVRSNDIALGNPYNVYQYYVLLRMIAQVSNIPAGELCFNLDIPHVYSRHIDSLLEQVSADIPDGEPIFELNENITSFYDFTLDDIKVTGYNNNGKFSYEVAV